MNPTSVKCKTEFDCKSNEKCILGNCLNKCSGILCKQGTTCVNGECLANQGCSKNN